MKQCPYCPEKVLGDWHLHCRINYLEALLDEAIGLLVEHGPMLTVQAKNLLARPEIAKLVKGERRI